MKRIFLALLLCFSLTTCIGFIGCTPSKPDSETEITNPSNPTNPSKPDDNNNPPSTENPDDSTLPDNPDNPENPTEPEMPDEPDKPVEPETPSIEIEEEYVLNKIQALKEFFESYYPLEEEKFSYLLEGDKCVLTINFSQYSEEGVSKEEIMEIVSEAINDLILDSAFDCNATYQNANILLTIKRLA